MPRTLPSLTPVLFALALFVAGPGASLAADADAAGRELFESKIRPVLVEQCFQCHSQEAAKNKKLRGGLFLDSREGVLKGGDSGAVIVPGKPDESLLLKTMRHDGDVKMPPKGKLDDAVLADFRRWVAMGAPDPRDGKVTTARVIDLEKGRQYWAFRPPVAVEPPMVEGATSAIDRFLLARLKEKGIPLAPKADPHTLVRRLYFDLIGLPPTAEQVAAFERDGLEKTVDALLASPHHGERWARHWLDVARYAEDQAHTFGVKPKPNAYRYRDWVIRAFNDDMPYDRFVRLQIAGDLVDPSEGDVFQRTAGLGFLGLGAEYYKNSAKDQAVAEELDDRVDTLTRGFLGLTVSCARCHDHKFDPIPQRDYYSLAGIFNGSTLTEAPLASPEEVRQYDQGQARIKEIDDKVKGMLGGLSKGPLREAVGKTGKYLTTAWRVQVCKQAKVAVDVAALAQAEGLNKLFLDRWVGIVASAGSKPALLAKDWPGSKLPTEKPADVASVKVPEAIEKFATEFEKKAKAAHEANKTQDAFTKALLLDGGAPFLLTPAETEQHFASADERKQLAEMRSELETRKKVAPAIYATAPVLKGGGQTMKVFVRGNPLQPGEQAPKGFLQVVQPCLGNVTSPDYSRLDLASAIASAKNPLTARVIVNRVWQQHFGRGLVGTPSNLGELGERPTHPELLDWLAVRFMENGWSLKWLHRQIVSSAAYQRASLDPEGQKADPQNVYLGRMSRRRLEVEVYRDSLLAVAGTLDETMGGPTFDLKNASARRRTVYGKVSRHELDGTLRLFDFPDANVTADRRVVTTVPQQQLFVLNSDFMQNQARAFAERIEKGATTDADRIKLAYRLAFGRAPSDKELSLGIAYVTRPLPPEASGDGKPTRWQQYAHALLATNEFLYVD
jgi:cytochrome c553